MKGTPQKLIVISFVLALLATVVAFIYLQSLNSPKETVKKISIIVAAENISARTLIDKKMLKEIEVSDSSIFNDYIKDYSAIVGKYAKETILKNEGFIKEKLLSRDGGELSLKIDKEHRAISINITADGGVAKLIKPADFVDVIVYLPEKKDGPKVIRPELSKIILQGIEILGIENQLTREDTSKDKAKEKENMAGTFLVTLSVLANDVEKLVLAENIGQLKLALRPIDTNLINNTDGTIWEELMGDTKTDINGGGAEEKNSEEGKVSEGNKTISNADNSSKYTYYTVKKGDTLRSISKAFYGDSSKYTLIKEGNNIKNEDVIITGEELIIPKQ